MARNGSQWPGMAYGGLGTNADSVPNDSPGGNSD
jgi:hypothetical protein